MFLGRLRLRIMLVEPNLLDNKQLKAVPPPQSRGGTLLNILNANELRSTRKIRKLFRTFAGDYERI